VGEPPCFNQPIAAEVFIALGTNLGDRAENLRRAIAALAHIATVEAVSRVYESEPVGFRDQPDYWNLVVRIRTELEPAPLFQALKAIEQQLGRTADFRNAPRIIDLDIIAYDQLVLHNETLEIPHPRMHQRSFVLYPLAELAPEFRHPVDGRSIQQLIAALDQPTRAIALDNALAETHR
jgi:2-amino-4-hydroxy-6-hydroxymethyldihydropteridine diphosphokinase